MKKVSDLNSEEQKRQRWFDTLKNLDEIVDGLGMKIDENIKETVAAFNINGIPTDGSCGGHTEGRLGFPYIMGKPLDEPEYRWVGQQNLNSEILKKYNLKTVREIYSDSKAEAEYNKRVEEELKFIETEQYKEWYKKVQPLEKEVGTLIEEFYKNRMISDDQKLHLSPLYAHYDIESGLEIESLQQSNVSVVAIKAKIHASQEEFKLFTEFLKQKYFLV
jgi:hypothetical protein